jgi:hypothetical protein
MQLVSNGFDDSVAILLLRCVCGLLNLAVENRFRNVFWILLLLALGPGLILPIYLADNCRTRW